MCPFYRGVGLIEESIKRESTVHYFNLYNVALKKKGP